MENSMRQTEQKKVRLNLIAILFKRGLITRTECFRLEMDEALAENTGQVNFIAARVRGRN